jgi:hypothetical protein
MVLNQLTSTPISKNKNSCVRICESSCCFLAAFLIHSCCVCLSNNLTVDYGTKSTYEHYHFLKILNSYVKICVRSCCFLAAFSICSRCNIVSIATHGVVKVAVVTAIKLFVAAKYLDHKERLNGMRPSMSKVALECHVSKKFAVKIEHELMENSRILAPEEILIAGVFQLDLDHGVCLLKISSSSICYIDKIQHGP